MASNEVLHAQITVALRCLRQARFTGNPEAIEVAETHLNRLLERLKGGAPNAQPAPLRT